MNPAPKAMKEAIETLVQRRNHVSYAEFSREIKGFRGESWYELPGNVVLWADLSEDACASIQELVKGGRIHAEPAPALVYIIDGGMINLPLARRLPIEGYKEPHWLPVTYSPGPHLTEIKSDDTER